jgi:hypothetical protein
MESTEIGYLLDLAGTLEDPIDLFDKQLGLFTEKCLASGEQIILGIDINEDIRVTKFSKKK